MVTTNQQVVCSSRYQLLLKAMLGEMLVSRGTICYQLIWLFCLGPLVFLLPNIFRLFGFQIFWLRSYLMKIIPETRRGTKCDIQAFIIQSIDVCLYVEQHNRKSFRFLAKMENFEFPLLYFLQRIKRIPRLQSFGQFIGKQFITQFTSKLHFYLHVFFKGKLILRYYDKENNLEKNS